MSIVVEHLSVTPFGASAPVLNDVSFTLADGERALLLGPSGAGKSTLLLALTGVLQTLETASVEGAASLTQCGLLLQNYSDATISDEVRRDVAFGAESAGVPAMAMSALVDDALARVDLAVLAGEAGQRNPATLSGGELQRVCLAGLLTMQPRVLLLDEPTSQLDQEAAAAVRSAVRDYLEHSGATALVVEHQFLPWLPLINRVLVLDGSGQLIADGPWAEVSTAQAQMLDDWGLWTGSAKLVAVADWQVPGGKISALVGHSGSGKSTRLRLRLEAALGEGRIRVGWLPQNPSLALIQNSARECLLSVATPEAADDWLARFGLSALASHNPHELSGGEQKRLALAVALAARPSELFLDEPTVGLDKHNWTIVVTEILRAASEGVAVTVATHDAELVGYATTVEHVVSPLPIASAKETAKPPFSALGLLAAATVTLVGALNFSGLNGAALALAAECLLLAILVLAYPSLRRLALLMPILIGVASVGFSNWWLSSNHAVVPAVLAAVRVAFFGVPGLLFAAAISPSVLGDQLGQQLKLPARPVVAAMVGLNRVHQLQSTWRNLVLMRRVAGLPTRGLRALTDVTIGSLIAATWGAQIASIAMEARGFSATDDSGRRLKRSWLVRARWGAGDAWLMLAAAALVGVGLLAH